MSKLHPPNRISGYATVKHCVKIKQIQQKSTENVTITVPGLHVTPLL